MTTKARILLFLCLVIIAAAPVTSLMPCPRDWLPFEKKCLRVSRYILRSALASRMTCRGLNHAAIPFRPLNARQNQMAHHLAKSASTSSVWLAFYRLRGWRDYRWVNTRGGAGYKPQWWRPETSRGQRCVTLSVSDGRWKPTPDCQQHRSHVCELCRSGQVGCICGGPWDCAGTQGARCGSRGVCQCSGGLQYDSAKQRCAVCPSDWRQWRDKAGRRHCYLLPPEGRLRISSKSAVYLARRVGAALEPRRFVHLLTVTSAEEGTKVRSWLPAASKLVWLDLHGRGTTNWRWQSGEPVNFTSWARTLQEPNGHNETDNCAVWANFRAAGYGWADIACNGSYRAYPAFEFEY